MGVGRRAEGDSQGEIGGRGADGSFVAPSFPASIKGAGDAEGASDGAAGRVQVSDKVQDR